MAKRARKNGNMNTADRDIDSRVREKLEDDNFYRMKAALECYVFGEGPSPAPEFTHQPLTNKLLLQLYCLKRQLQISWDDIWKLFPKVTDPENLLELSLKLEVEKTVAECAKIKDQQTDHLDAFLSIDRGLTIWGRNVGLHLIKHNIYRQHLLDYDLLTKLEPPSELTNGMVIDIIHFYKKERLQLVSCHKTLQFLGADLKGLSVTMISSRLKKLMTKYQSLAKNAHRPNGRERLEAFLSSSLEFDVKPNISKPPSSQYFPTRQDLNVAKLQITAAMLRRKLEETENNLVLEKQKNDILTEASLSHCETARCVRGELSSLKQKHYELQESNQNLRQQLEKSLETVKAIRSTAMYKHLQRKGRELEKKRAVLAAHENGHCVKKERELKRKIKLEQTKCSNLRKQMACLRAQLEGKVEQEHQENISE